MQEKRPAPDVRVRKLKKPGWSKMTVFASASTAAAASPSSARRPSCPSPLTAFLDPR